MAVFFLSVAGVIQTQKEKTQEGDKLYRLWFVVNSTRSVYCHSAGARVELIKDADI